MISHMTEAVEAKNEGRRGLLKDSCLNGHSLKMNRPSQNVLLVKWSQEIRVSKNGLRFPL